MLADNKVNAHVLDGISSIHLYQNMQIFHKLEEHGYCVELPWNKVTVLFNLARLLEQLHNTETASLFYRLILFKVGMNVLIVIYLFLVYKNHELSIG